MSRVTNTIVVRHCNTNRQSKDLLKTDKIDETKMLILLISTKKYIISRLKSAYYNYICKNK